MPKKKNETKNRKHQTGPVTAAILVLPVLFVSGFFQHYNDSTAL